jgi:hypothetical protein
VARDRAETWGGDSRAAADVAERMIICCGIVETNDDTE